MNFDEILVASWRKKFSFTRKSHVPLLNGSTLKSNTLLVNKKKKKYGRIWKMIEEN